MSAFASCFLFLDNPRGGVEDIAYVASKAPWVKTLFLNVRDYDPDEWQTVRARASAAGIRTGPWSPTNDRATGDFSPRHLDDLVSVADEWRDSPLIVNPEKDIDGSGSEITAYMARNLGGREAAFSVQAWPFDSVDWRPLRSYPILPQIFPAESEAAKDPARCKARWHERGAELVYFTFGTYGGMRPSDFALQAAYSLFPGDPVLATYSLELWQPRSSGFDPTSGATVPPPPNAAQLAPAYLARIGELAREWEELEPSSTPLARLTIIRRIAESTGPEWNASRQAIAIALDGAGVDP